MATILNMKAPINTDKAFWDTSSVTTILKDLGVAVLLAEENAESIGATAKMEITSILADIVFRRPSTDSFFIGNQIIYFKTVCQIGQQCTCNRKQTEYKRSKP